MKLHYASSWSCSIMPRALDLLSNYFIGLNQKSLRTLPWYFTVRRMIEIILIKLIKGNMSGTIYSRICSSSRPTVPLIHVNLSTICSDLRKEHYVPCLPDLPTRKPATPGWNTSSAPQLHSPEKDGVCPG